MCLSSEKPSSVFEAISSRRSVRAYAPEILDHGTVSKLLKAAVRAPTAMHAEPWAFVVVQDRALLKKLSDRAKPLFLEKLHHAPAIFQDPGFDVFHGAGTLVVICAKPGPFSDADCWLAAENLMLAACAAGLGSCVIGSSVDALNLPESKQELGIPPEYDAVAPIVVGATSGEAPPTSRRDPAVLAWL